MNPLYDPTPLGIPRDVFAIGGFLVWAYLIEAMHWRRRQRERIAASPRKRSVSAEKGASWKARA